MTTVFEYSQRNILVIPQALYAMKDITALLVHGDSGIFYKDLVHDLIDIEFYTNIPCVVYIESGLETITTFDNVSYEISAGTAIFLPRGINLHSDYVKTTKNLKAYLVFFTEDVLTDFISTVKTKDINTEFQSELTKVQCGSIIQLYFRSIQLLKQQGDISAALVKLKLLELLHLLSLYNEELVKAVLQSKQVSSSPKRNLTRLLNNNDILNLTITDLANLSGRSHSTFTREFKTSYGMTPKKWLQNKRMNRAKELLMNTEFTVTYVAADLGYENVSHFIKAFKEKYKLTPKQFKQHT